MTIHHIFKTMITATLSSSSSPPGLSSCCRQCISCFRASFLPKWSSWSNISEWIGFGEMQSGRSEMWFIKVDCDLWFQFFSTVNNSKWSTSLIHYTTRKLFPPYPLVFITLALCLMVHQCEKKVCSLYSAQVFQAQQVLGMIAQGCVDQFGELYRCSDKYSNETNNEHLKSSVFPNFPEHFWPFTEHLIVNCN